MLYEYILKVLSRFELEFPDSKSDVIKPLHYRTGFATSMMF